MQRLRFNVVRFAARPAVPGERSLVFIDRLIAGAPDPRVLLPLERPAATVRVTADMPAGYVAVEAWSAIARGAGGVVFDDWTALQANAEAASAAAAFAEAVSRNVTLYAPLRPVPPTAPGRRVRTASGTGIDAALLESADALVLIAVNRRARAETAILAFSPDVPEAIWQNMLAGGAVNFVAGPEGPVYERTFQPHDVLVLAIRRGRG